MKNIYQKLKKPARCAALAIVILFGLTYVYFKFIVRDIDKIDDSKMELKYTPVPVHENAFPLLVMAEVPLNDPLNENLLNELKTIDEKLERNNGRLTLKAEKLVKLHFREKIALLERAADMKYSQAININQQNNIEPWNQKILNYISLRSLANVRLALARKEFEKGRREQAVNGALTVLKLGSAIQHKDGGTSLISLMVGVGIKQKAVALLNEFLSSRYLPDDEKRDVIFSELNSAREARQPWENVWKGEYYVCSSVLNAWKNGRINLTEYLMSPKGAVENYVENIILGNTLKPETARRNCLDFYSLQIKNSGAASYSQTDMTLPRLINTDIFSLSNMLNGTMSTAIFNNVLIPNFRRTFQKRFYLDFLISATETRMALLSYEKKYGELPGKLDSLVPGFLPEIPMDAFDGKPLRYMKNNKTIYSVGLNLKDDGGNINAKYMSPFDEKMGDTTSKRDFVLKITP